MARIRHSAQIQQASQIQHPSQVPESLKVQHRANWLRPPSTWLQSFGARLMALVALILLLAISVRLAGSRHPRLEQRSSAPLVMGTTCRLVVVGRLEHLEGALRAARQALAEVERAMSTYDPDSELSRFNRSPVGQPMRLSAPTLEVLRECGQLSRQTDGAFDVTMRPLGQLWQQAGRRNQLPDSDELDRTRRKVGFAYLQITGDSATRQVDGLEVSLDAIAKGYAIHRAIQAMQAHGLAGGLVDVGGDIECFGRPADDPYWRIGLRDPRSDGQLLTLRLAGAGSPPVAVCTSGDYQRFVTIGGRRYSHIIDPRSGCPSERAASVTVIGPTATLADGWATALSVLGADEGMRRLPTDSGLEALLVIDGAPAQIRTTAGFARYVESGGTGFPPFEM